MSKKIQEAKKDLMKVIEEFEERKVLKKSNKIKVKCLKSYVYRGENIKVGEEISMSEINYFFINKVEKYFEKI